MIDAALQLSQEALDASNQAAVLQNGGKFKHRRPIRVLLLAAAVCAVLGPVAFHIIRAGDEASRNNAGAELRQGVLFLNYGEETSGAQVCETPTRLFMALESHADDYAARMAARSTWLRWAAHGAAGERAEYAFFSTDTAATRAEARAHGDLVLFTEDGALADEKTPVQPNREQRNSGSRSSGYGNSESTVHRRTAENTRSAVSEKGASPEKGTRRASGRGEGISKSTIAAGTSESREPTEGEEVKRHPKLCRDDQARLCSGLEAGGGRIDNCMFAFRKELNSACRADLAAFEAAHFGSKAREWYGKSATNKGRRLLGLLSKMGLYGQKEAASTEGAVPESPGTEEELVGRSFGAGKHRDVASSSNQAPSSTSVKHAPKPFSQQDLPWCGEAGHHPTSSSSTAASSSSSSSSWFSSSSSPSSSAGDGSSRLGGCLARPLSSFGGKAFRAPKPFVHHSNDVRSEQPFSSSAGSGLGSVHASVLPSTNAPHLVSRFRFSALEWAAKHAPPHAFFLWLDLTPRAPYTPLSPASQGPSSSSFQSARSNSGHEAGGGSGGGHFSGLGRLFTGRSSEGASSTGAANAEPTATPPPVQGEFSFLCLPSLLAELETRPHERFLWRRLPCGGTKTSSSPTTGDAAEVATAIQDDSFLLVSRDVAELLRGVARKPLPKSGHLLLLDRLLKRLPLTLLHDSHRLVRSSEVNWSSYEMLPVRGSEKPHPCDCLVWVHGASSHPMLPQPGPSSSSPPGSDRGNEEGQGWSSMLSSSFRRKLLVPPRHKLPSAQRQAATSSSSSSWWGDSTAADAAAAVAASAQGLGDDDETAVEAAGGALNALAASYWSSGKKGGARATKLGHLTSTNATVQRLFRAHAHLRYGLEPGDGHNKWNEWRHGGEEAQGGYPLIGYTSAQQARECEVADEAWSSLHVEMPGGVRSGATKSDRELVTAVRLGLNMPRAEAFLSQLRMLSATTATSSSSSSSLNNPPSSRAAPQSSAPKNVNSNPTKGREGSAGHDEMRAAAAAAVALDAEADASFSKGDSHRTHKQQRGESYGKEQEQERRKLEENNKGKSEDERKRSGGAALASSHKEQRRLDRAHATSSSSSLASNGQNGQESYSNANSLQARANEARTAQSSGNGLLDASSAMGRSGRFTGPDRTYGPDNLNSVTGARRRSSSSSGSSGNEWKRGAAQLPKVDAGASSGSRRAHLSVQQQNTEDQESEVDDLLVNNFYNEGGADGIVVHKPLTRRSLLKERQSFRKNARRATEQASTSSTASTSSSSSNNNSESTSKKKRAGPSLSAQVSSKNHNNAPPRAAASSSHASKASSSSSRARSLLPEVTSLGVRPRLHAWSEEVEDAQPVVDACSFDLECAWERVASEELRGLWQEADVARASCCCSARVSQAPPTCAAYKTRTFLLDDTEEDDGGGEELHSNDIGRSGVEEGSKANTNLDQRPSGGGAATAEEVEDEEGEEWPRNWTYTQEVEWLNAYARRQKNRQRKLQERYSNSRRTTTTTSSGSGTASMLQNNQRSHKPKRSRGVTVLSSFPGSGNTWVRLLVEYASGVFTGSIYHDTALSPLLPAEGDRSTRVALVKAHTAPEHFLAEIKKAPSATSRNTHGGSSTRRGVQPQGGSSASGPSDNGEANGGEVALVHPLANTRVQRVVLLVRHPFDAIWSEFQRRQTGSSSHADQVSQVQAREFEGFATCMACKWQQHLLKHLHLASNPWALFPNILPNDALKRGSAFPGGAKRRRMSAKGNIRVHIVQYERLRGANSFHDEVAKLLAFLDLPLPSPQRLACAPLLARHAAVQRPKPPNFKASDVYLTIPGLSCRLWRVLNAPPASKLMLRLLGYTMPTNATANTGATHDGAAAAATSEETCPEDDAYALPQGVCSDVMVNPDLPLQGCAGKGLAKFYPPRSTTASQTSLRGRSGGSGGTVPATANAAEAGQEVGMGSNADDDDGQVVNAMNGDTNGTASTIAEDKETDEEQEAEAEAEALSSAIGEGEVALAGSASESKLTETHHETNGNQNDILGVESSRGDHNFPSEPSESTPILKTRSGTHENDASSSVLPSAATASAAAATPISSFLASFTATTTTERSECGSSTSGQQGKQPLVAVLVSTTSRGVVKKGKTKALSAPELEKRMAWVEDTTKTLDFSELVLFTTMLPSLAASLECGFRYRVVVGFDQGDLLYDTAKTQSAVADWLQRHWVAKAKVRGIEATYQLLPVHNALKKPGPVFNALAAAVSGGESGGRTIATSLAVAATAEDQEADYIYRVNDDTEFKRDQWTSKFVQALQKLRGSATSPMLGVVGPSCPQGNRAILTHDFTHKTHLAVFGTYYPPELVDWWMDDWISRVYGSKRTLLLPNVEVVHHSKTYGRRYDVDGSNRHKVDRLVEQGKQLVVNYMTKHGATPREVQGYQSDSFNHRQSQKEVDQSTLVRKSAAVRPPGS